MNVNKFEQTIELDKIKEMWQSYARNDAVKRKITEFIPYLSETELKARMRETSESRELIEKYGEERGKTVRYAEAFELDPYGSQPDKEFEKFLFGF